MEATAISPYNMYCLHLAPLMKGNKRACVCIASLADFHEPAVALAIAHMLFNLGFWAVFLALSSWVVHRITVTPFSLSVRAVPCERAAARPPTGRRREPSRRNVHPFQ